MIANPNYVKRLKYLASCNDDVLPESTSNDQQIDYVEISDVFLSEGIKKSTAYKFGDAPSRARRIIKKDDVLISTVRTYLRAIAPVKAKDHGKIASTGFAVLRPHGICPKYFSFTCLSEHFIGEIISKSVGVSYPAINASDIMNIALYVPTLGIQRQIAAYLNRETAKIDKLIAKQQKLIKLLQEKRQAVISQAVTKGLDPSVKMKDSGVEWLGEVPEHWEVSNLTYVLAALGDIDHYMPETVDDGVPYVMTGDLKERASEICFEDCKKVSRCDYEKLSRRIKTSPGDVIMARYATIGTATYMDIDKELLISYSCVTIKPDLNVLIGKFLFFFLRSTVFQSAIKNIVNTNTQANVGIGDLKKVKIALPSVVEQKTIVGFIDSSLAELTNLMEKALHSINLMKEHRQALITAAVTGEIDVRGLVTDEEVAALDAEPEVKTTEEDFTSEVLEDSYITEEE